MTADEAKNKEQYAIKRLQDAKDGYKEYLTDEALDIAIEALEQTKWIPVSERLPEDKTTVLISCEDMYLQKLNPCVGWRNGQYWNTFTANGCKQILYPTAWMPLPEPYKGE